MMYYGQKCYPKRTSSSNALSTVCSEFGKVLACMLSRKRGWLDKIVVESSGHGGNQTGVWILALPFNGCVTWVSHLISLCFIVLICKMQYCLQDLTCCVFIICQVVLSAEDPLLNKEALDLCMELIL